MHLSKIALAALLIAPAALHAQTTKFTSNFSTGERVATGGTYDVGDWTLASTKNTTGISYGTGAFTFGMAATTSGFVEAQNRFSATATTISNVGEWIELKVKFTNGSNLLAGGTSSLINIGLFDSGGANPTPGLESSGLTATDTSPVGSGFASGNAQNWEGYVGRFALTGGTNQIYTRAPQLADATVGGSTSENQDLLFSNVGNGAFDNPSGTQLGTTSTSTQAALSAATQYTAKLRITVSGASEYTVDYVLMNGAGDTTLQTLSRTTVSGSFINNLSIDGLAIGYRQSGTSLATSISLNSVDVTVNAIPEPSSFAALAGLAGLGFAATRRRRAA